MNHNHDVAERSRAIGRLTEGQHDCLQRVLSRRNSKEIAQELGVSPHTVDQRLRLAMQTLGATSRFEAARMVFEPDDDEAYQRPVYQRPDIAEGGPDASPLTSPEIDGAGNIEHGVAMGGHAANCACHSCGGPRKGSIPLPMRRGGGNDLTPATRLMWVVALLVGVVLAVGIFISAAESLGRIYRSTSL